MVSAILTPLRGDVSSWDPDFAHRKMARLLQDMSLLDIYKAKLTEASNALRQKMDAVDDLVMERMVFANDSVGGTECAPGQERELLSALCSIGRSLCQLRSCWFEAVEFGDQRLRYSEVSSFLKDIQAHWEVNGMSSLTEGADGLLARLDVVIRLLPESKAAILPSVSKDASTASYSSVSSSLSSALPIVNLQNPHVFHCSAKKSDSVSHLRSSLRPIPSASCDSSSLVPACDHLSLMETGDHQQSHAPIAPTIPLSPLQCSATNSRDASEQPSQLPPIALPKFCGEIEAFPAFWSTFSAVVHNDNTLPVSVKFLYLKSCLEGKARDLVTVYPVSANYHYAVRAVLAVYDCPEILRSKLLDKLSQIPPSTESINMQCSTLSVLRGLWSQLHKMNESCESASTSKLILSKFPQCTLQKVHELKEAADSAWTVDVLLEVIEVVLEQQLQKPCSTAISTPSYEPSN